MKFLNLFRWAAAASAPSGHMSSDDAQDREPPPSQSSSGLFHSFRSRSKVHTPSDGPPEQSLVPGFLSRTRSRGTLVDRDAAARASPTLSMSSHAEPPSKERILEDVKPQNSASVRQDALKWVSERSQTMDPKEMFAVLEAAKDLLDPKYRADTRTAVYVAVESLLRKLELNLSQCQHEFLFMLLSIPLPPDDLKLRLECLIRLKDAGARLKLRPLRYMPLISTWMDQWFPYMATRRQEQRRKKENNADSIRSYGSSIGSDSPADEELIYPRLCNLVCDALTEEDQTFVEEDIKGLLEQVIKICKKTTLASDIENSIHVFNAVIQRSSIPEIHLPATLDVLCGTFFNVKLLQELSFDSICKFLKSTSQADILRTMYQFLASTSPESRNLNVVRGVIAVFTNLIAAQGKDQLPLPRFDALVSALSKSLARDSAKLEGDILRLCHAYLEEHVVVNTLQNDWTIFFEVMGNSSRRIVSGVDGSVNASTKGIRSSGPLEYIADQSFLVARSLESAWPQLTEKQKMLTSEYLVRLYRLLDPSQAQLLLKYYDSEGLAVGQSSWLENAGFLVNSIYKDEAYAAETRLFALAALRNAYLKDGASTVFNNHKLLEKLMDSLKSEQHEVIYEPTMIFLVDAADVCSMETLREKDTFKEILTCLLECMKASEPARASTPSSPTVSSPMNTEPTSTLANTASKGLVQILLRALNTSAMKSILCFDCLLELARFDGISTDARVTALKLLFRIRSDSNGSIYVISESESEHVAAALCRTVESENTPTPRDGRTMDRVPQTEEGEASQGLRISMTSGLSRSGTRGAGGARPIKRLPPLWMYPGPKGLPEDPPSTPSQIVFASSALAALALGKGQHVEDDEPAALKINQWLELIITLLQRKDEDWEVSSYVLVHLGSQLMNTNLFHSSVPQLKLLRSILVDQVMNLKYHEPPKSTGLRKSDVAVCVFHIITVLVTFHEHFSKSENDDLVRSFNHGISSGLGDGTSRTCIHALSICCHEIPKSVTRILTAILENMSRIITQSQLAVHILEFLAELARIPDVYSNLRDELRLVFGVCARYLQTAREDRSETTGTSSARTSYASRHSGSVREFSSLQESSEPAVANELPQYVYALTYHVMIFWFLSLKLQDRAHHVKWITKSLIYKNELGTEVLEEQSEVFIDMMQRTTYSDLGDTLYKPDFATSSDGPIQQKSWLVGMSIVTIETAGTKGLTQITKRQASGTTHSSYQQLTAERLPHHIPLYTSIQAGDELPVSMLPSHILLQLTTSAFPTYVEMQPIPLPNDESTKRAIRSFDRNDIVDGHKVGIVYVSEGQTREVDILGNASGSADYHEFLEGLGTKVPLDGAKFNTHGLDKNVDGEHTYAWRDRVTEIIFHVATLMPSNLENDPICASKKRHIGNDFVTIIYNESNLPYKFDTIPSEFNYVNIVITPANRSSKPLQVDTVKDSTTQDETSKGAPKKSSPSFFKVQVISRPGFPKISPASDVKVLSKENLSAFVRLISLNASVFSLVWSKRGQDDEHISSWRNRLREIRKLRERTLENIVKAAATEAVKVESGPSRRMSSYPEGENTRMKALAASAGYPEVDNLVDVLNFSGWTE